MFDGVIVCVPESAFDNPASLCDMCWYEWYLSGIWNVKSAIREWNIFFKANGKYSLIDHSANSKVFYFWFWAVVFVSITYLSWVLFK